MDKTRSDMANVYERFKRFTNTNPIIRPFKWALTHKVQRAFFRSLKRTDDKVRYQVHGMHRTGNHIIITSIMKGRPGNVVLCNDLRIGEHPIDSYMKLMRFGKGTAAIISGYEDMPHQEWDTAEHVEWYGHTAAIHQIIILRDPFNLLASRYVWKFPQGRRFREDGAYRHKVVDLWKDHARTYLEWEQRQPEGKVTYTAVNYNRWIQDRSYREAQARILDLNDPHIGLGETPDFGGGSSFNGRDRTPEVSSRYTQRFFDLLDQADFTRIFRDSELLDLSDRIFGRLEGVDVLLKKAHEQ